MCHSTKPDQISSTVRFSQSYYRPFGRIGSSNNKRASPAIQLVKSKAASSVPLPSCRQHPLPHFCIAGCLLRIAPELLGGPLRLHLVRANRTADTLLLPYR